MLQVGGPKTFPTIRGRDQFCYTRFCAFVLKEGSVLHRTSPILLLLAVLSLISTPPARADAVLFIYPTLVMFEGNQRSAEITLTNRGDQTGTFEMSWSDMTMTPEGGLAKFEGQAPWSVQQLRCPV